MNIPQSTFSIQQAEWALKKRSQILSILGPGSPLRDNGLQGPVWSGPHLQCDPLFYLYCCYASTSMYLLFNGHWHWTWYIQFSLTFSPDIHLISYLFKIFVQIPPSLVRPSLTTLLQFLSPAPSLLPRFIYCHDTFISIILYILP